MRALSEDEMHAVAGGETVVVVTGKPSNIEAAQQLQAAWNAQAQLNQYAATQASLVKVGGLGDVKDAISLADWLAKMFPNPKAREDAYAANGTDAHFKDFQQVGPNTYKDDKGNFWLDTNHNGRIDTMVTMGSNGLWVDTDGNGTAETPARNTPFDFTIDYFKN